MPKIKLNMEKSEFRTVIHLQMNTTAHHLHCTTNILPMNWELPRHPLTTIFINFLMMPNLFIQIINAPSGKGFYM